MKNIFITLFILCVGVLLFSSCQKEISSETGVQQIAAGSLLDSLGNCSPDSVFGTFYGGVAPGSDTAYVEVQVNVTQVGSYTIETDLQNGIQFADSGFFTTTGINTVLLKPVGIPIQPIGTAVPPATFTYSVMFDSSLCNFSVTFLDSTGTGIHSGGDNTSGNWQFSTDAGGIFSGSVLSANFSPDTLENGSVNGYKFFLLGVTPSQDSGIELEVLMPQNIITPGSYNTLTYNSDSSKTTGFEFCPTNGDDCFYFADGVSDDPTVKITINIASYNSTTRIVSGTFSGVAVVGSDFNGDPDNPTKTINIQNGSFTATVSP